LPSRSSRLAQVFHSASFPDSKTSLTSFSLGHGLLISPYLSRFGLDIFHVSVCQRTILLSFFVEGAGFEPALFYTQPTFPL